MTNAIGIHDPSEVAKIAKTVPSIVRRNDCNTRLWASCECKSGSLYEERDVAAHGQRLSSRDGTYAGCKAWAYYD